MVASPGGAPAFGESPGRAGAGEPAGGAGQGTRPGMGRGMQREAQSLLFLRLLPGLPCAHPSTLTS